MEDEEQSQTESLQKQIELLTDEELLPIETILNKAPINGCPDNKAEHRSEQHSYSGEEAALHRLGIRFRLR
jgi:hypothetical protein